jgi:serine/threonine-protein kinase
MSRKTDPARDLLFGLLALQNGLVDQNQLVAAFRAWTREKERSLADHLVALGHLDATHRPLIEGLAAVHLARNGGDAEKSLAAISAGRSTRESLARVGDVDLDASLIQLGAGDRTVDDADRTASYAVGSATSDGQRFRVLRPHASGGLGAVFVALDTELHREVALKQILESHSNDPISRARFILEAEVTGGLEHPGIVPVYGLGTNGDGRPYYAMRFIRGDSLKEAIERFHAERALKHDAGRRSLELRKLLRRFTDVCNAIEYAHSRGVLHRDINPGNVIVGRHGETLVVDWGLAKPIGRVDTSSDSGEGTLVPCSASGSADTVPGSVMGTPAYMSPEQAGGELDKVGPRSDVYSLGVTLYCLLSGKAPFAGDDVAAVLRSVKAGDFPHPRRVNSAIDHGLEAICLKAMRRAPEDRYATPRELADDIERWTADEPVLAWREPLFRRARRWARKHRTAVTAAAAAAVAAVAGLLLVLVVQTQANRRLRQANINEHSARQTAQDRLALALEAIKAYHSGASQDILLKEPQFGELRTRLLARSLDFYRKLGSQLERDRDGGAAARPALAEATSQIAELTDQIGSKREALEGSERALALWETVAREQPRDPRHPREVAFSLLRIARIQADNGRRDAAAASYQRCLAELESLAGENPRDIRSRTGLASALQGLGILRADGGQRTGAQALLQRSLELFQALARADPNDPNFPGSVARIQESLGLMEANRGRTDEALALLDQAKATGERLARDNPAIGSFRGRLGWTLTNLGLLQWRLGRIDQARGSFEQARDLQETLFRQYPTVTQYEADLAASFGNLSNLESEAGRNDAALDAIDRARAILERLARNNPSYTAYRRDLGTTYNNGGFALYKSHRLPESRIQLERALEIRRELVRQNPDMSRLRRHLARTCYNLGRVYRDQGHSEEAIRSFDEVRTILSALPDAGPDDRLQEAGAWVQRALLAGSNPTDQREALEEAMALIKQAVAANPAIIADVRREDSLGPLLVFPEFRDMLDQGFPTDPFGPG